MLSHLERYCQYEDRVWHSIFLVAVYTLKYLCVLGCSFSLLLFSWDTNLEAGTFPTGRDPPVPTELGESLRDSKHLPRALYWEQLCEDAEAGYRSTCVDPSTMCLAAQGSRQPASIPPAKAMEELA